MQILNLILASLLIVIVSSLGVNSAFSAEIKYEPNGVELRHNPTICSIQPVDPDLTKNELEKFDTQTQSAIDEWEQRLKDRAGKKNWSNWEINHRHFTYDKINSDSILACDVVVMFSKTPLTLDFWNILGLAMSDYYTGKTLIEIYYSVPELCDSGERKRVGDTIYIFQEPCYGDMMVSDQLGGVIKHEMGHGFGLGHYMSTDEDVTLEWNQGLSPTPSIMVQTSYENSDELRISTKDIDKLNDIYGNDGFILNSDEEKNLTLENPYLEEQNYVDFKNDEYGFTFQYPDKWGVDDNVEVLGDFTGLLSITDEIESFNRSLKVGFHDQSFLKGSTDENIFEGMIDNEQKNCNDFLAEDFGFDCDNLILLETKSKNGENGKVYTIKSIWNDGTHHQIIHRNFIFSGDKVWEISGYGPLAPFLLNNEMMEYSINSFKFDMISIPNDTPISSKLKNQTQIDPPSLQLDTGPDDLTQIPDWVRGNAGWWSQGEIGDSDFVSGIQYLIKEGIMTIPETVKSKVEGNSKDIPSWIKNNADWWSQGLITDGDFVKGIQYLVEQGIIEV